jgi:hypothetical protein
MMTGLRSTSAVLLALVCSIAAQDPSVTVQASRTIALNRLAETHAVTVRLENYERTAQLSSFRVLVGTLDITGNVVRRHYVPIDRNWSNNPGLLQTRLLVFELDLSALPRVVDTRIDFRAVVQSARGISSGGAQTLLSPPEGELPQCVKDCICAFITAIGATKDADGCVKLSLSGAPPHYEMADLSNAAKALKACLLACDYIHISSRRLTCGDLTVLISARGDNGADSLDASASGSADVVIAVGGNACVTCTMDGGSATATNTQPGGASVAIGGNGGDHFNGSGNGNQPGNGGTATAQSIPPNGGGGDSAALGGDGGDGPQSGGNGADGSATTNGSCGDAYGGGGDGGDPRNDPPTTTTGGKGGKGTSSTPGGSGSAPGCGQPGGNSLNPGNHGQGGAVNTGPGIQNGQQFYGGTNLPNQ